MFLILFVVIGICLLAGILIFIKKKSFLKNNTENISHLEEDNFDFEERYGEHHCNGLKCNPNEECTDYEKLFCRTILYRSGIPKDKIFGNYLAKVPSGLAKINFALKGENGCDIAIDFNTYSTHEFLNQEKLELYLKRHNELIIAGWRVIKFSFKQIIYDTESCIEAVKNAFKENYKIVSPLKLPIIYVDYNLSQGAQNIFQTLKPVFSKVRDTWHGICSNINEFTETEKKILTFWIKCLKSNCDGRAIRVKIPGPDGFYWRCDSCNTFYSDKDGKPYKKLN